MATLEEQLGRLIRTLEAQQTGTPTSPTVPGTQIDQETEEEINELYEERIKLARALADAEDANSAERLQAEQGLFELQQEQQTELAKLRRQQLIDAAQGDQALIDQANAAFAQRINQIERVRRANNESYEQQLEQIQQVTEAHRQGLQDVQGLAEGFASALGMSNSYAESTVGRFQNMGDVLQNATGPEIAQLRDNMAKMFSIGNLLSSIFDKVVESTVMAARAFDSMSASINSTTGAAGRFNREIEFTSFSTGALGAGVEEVGSAFGELFNNMTNFTSLSKEQRQAVATLAVGLERLGISSATTGANLEFLTKSMGLSAEEAIAQQTEMAEFANTIGVAPANLAESFKAAQPIMVKFGKDVGEKVFRNLSKTAKNTGIEMSALLGIAQQFDTFESAAQSAGKLNALLGGPLLSSVELLTAREDERVQMLRSAVIESGRNFNELNRFEQQAIASAAGISDLTEASKLFGTTDEEFNANADAQANLAEMIDKTQTVQDKLNQVMMKFAAPVGMVADALSYLLSALLRLMDEFPRVTKVITTFVTVLGTVIIAKSIFVMITTVLGAFSIGATLASIAVGALNLTLGALALIFSPITLAVLAVTAAIVGLIYYFDELDAGVKNLTGGFFDMKDVLLFIMGPIGMLIIAGRKLYDNWDEIVTELTEIWQSFATFIGSLWSGIVNSAKAPLNSLVKLFNQTLGSINITFPTWVPMVGGQSFGVPKIPMLAEGGVVKTSGMALVGEKGPELVTLQANSRVIPNSELRAATTDNKTTRSPESRGATMGAGTSRPQVPTTVVLQLNDREFARAVIKAMDNKLDLSLGNGG